MDLVQTVVTVFLFFFILGSLVVFHELGHFVTARLAGIQAAKRTDELVPLAHPLEAPDLVKHPVAAAHCCIRYWNVTVAKARSTLSCPVYCVWFAPKLTVWGDGREMVFIPGVTCRRAGYERVRTRAFVIGTLIFPIFIVEGENQLQPIDSMPGMYRVSIDRLLEEARRG